MHWLTGAWAVFRKDVQIELRNRYALNALGMFVAASLLVVYFALRDAEWTPPVRAAVLWVVILFAASVGLGRAFVAEEERGTVLLLHLHLRASMVYAGKLAYNLALTLALNLAATGGFLVVTAASVHAPGLLLLTLALGALGLAGTTTLLAAIIARTANRGPLLAVLAFPLLIPLLFSVVNLTLLATQPLPPLLDLWATAQQDLVSLVGYAGLMISASVLLFDVVWLD